MIGTYVQTRDGNGYPPPVYLRVKNPIRVRVWEILPPTGLLTGENLTHRVKWCGCVLEYPVPVTRWVPRLSMTGTDIWSFTETYAV
jgi:hypothetical protein